MPTNTWHARQLMLLGETSDRQIQTCLARWINDTERGVRCTSAATRGIERGSASLGPKEVGGIEISNSGNRWAFHFSVRSVAVSPCYCSCEGSPSIGTRVESSSGGGGAVSSVSIVTGRTELWITVTDFLITKHVHIGFGPPNASYSKDTGFFLWSKAAGASGRPRTSI